MRASKVAAIITIPLTILLTTSYLYLVYKNNLEIPEPSTEEIRYSLNKSINWVIQNQDELILIDNPALWWFINESATLTNNFKLASLVNKYRNTVLDKHSIWKGFFIKDTSFVYIIGSLDFLVDYQKFFIYGFTCDSELGEEQLIQDQLKLNYCNWRPYYSSCTTHQLMGIRLLQSNHCGNPQQNQNLSDELSHIIEKQLTWDPRVGDVYIQRALMLVESGHQDKVKPVWIHNILHEQLDDGGWASFDRLIPLANNKYFGFNYKFVGINSPSSNFHTTAQAIYLLSLLLAHNENR